MNNEWGSVDGDGNADAIISQRREGRVSIKINAFANFALLASFAVWFSLTESSTALALEIIAASWLVVSGVTREIYEAYTMVMIAERRTQLLEQKVSDIQSNLADLSRQNSTYFS